MTQKYRSAKVAGIRAWAEEMQNATGGEVAPSASTSGARPTPNALKEIVMPKSNPALPEIQIIGDGTPNTSHGIALVWAEGGTINLVLPDRFGISSMINLTFDDAATITAALDRALDEELAK